MNSPELQSYWYVALNLKNIRTGAVVTYNFGSRSFYTDLSNYYPLLEEIGALSYAMGSYLPQERSSSIILKNHPGSFGADRKISDLFQELTPVEQEIVVYVKYATIVDADLSTGATRIYRATVRNWQATPNGRLTLSIQSGLIPKGIAGAPIPNTLAGISSKAVGKAYPVILGQSVEAPATLFEDSATQPSFSFSCFMKGFAPNNTGVSLYAKNSRGEYSKVQNASTSAITYGTSGARTNMNPISLDTQRWIRRVATGSEGAIVSAVWLNIRSLGSGARTSKISCQIWKSDEFLAYDPSGRTKVGILTGTITTAAINEDKDGYLFAESPIVLEPNSYYYFDFDFKDATSAHYWNSINATPENILIAETGSGDAAPWTFTTSAYTDRWGVFCCGWSIATTTQEDRGWSWAHARVSRDTVSGVTTDFRKLAIAGKFNGMADDGTLGLSAGTLITSAKSAIDLLCRDWNGTAWVNSTLDTSLFTDCHPGVRQNTADPYNRSIGGYLGANLTVSQLLENLCRSSACRLAPVNSATTGKYLALVAWGNTQQVSGVFTDENSTIVSFYQSGSETIVNDVTLVYGKSAIDQRFEEALLEGRTRGYNYVTRYNKDTNLRSADLCNESYLAYGSRENAVQAYDFLNDTQSALIAGESTAGIFGQAHSFVQLDASFLDFMSSLECLKVFDIVHPDLPSYFGTSSNAALPTYDGQPVDLLQGHYWKKAQRYRAVVEEYIISPNLGGFPRVRVILRLLTNFGKDLT